MPIVTIVLVLCVLGFVAYLLQTAPLPISPWWKNLIVGVICFATILWLLNHLGVYTVPLHWK